MTRKRAIEAAIDDWCTGSKQVAEAIAMAYDGGKAAGRIAGLREAARMISGPVGSWSSEFPDDRIRTRARELAKKARGK